PTSNERAPVAKSYSSRHALKISDSKVTRRFSASIHNRPTVTSWRNRFLKSLLPMAARKSMSRFWEDIRQDLLPARRPLFSIIFRSSRDRLLKNHSPFWLTPLRASLRLTLPCLFPSQAMGDLDSWILPDARSLRPRLRH